MKAELREITENQRRCERAVVRSSVMPSAKYSCPGSPVMLAKGSTTIMGRPAGAACGEGALIGSSAGAAAGGCAGAGAAEAVVPARDTSAAHR